MTGKSQDLYERVFMYIEQIFKLQPTRFMTDFESGMRAAIKKCYPEAKLHGCWYHFCAALRRRLCSLQLLRVIANSEQARRIYRKMLSLPLLPEEHIESGYLLIKEEARQNKLHRLFKVFFDYFERFWLNLVRYLDLKTLSIHTEKQKKITFMVLSEFKIFIICSKPINENYFFT